MDYQLLFTAILDMKGLFCFQFLSFGGCIEIYPKARKNTNQQHIDLSVRANVHQPNNIELPQTHKEKDFKHNKKNILDS